MNVWIDGQLHAGALRGGAGDESGELIENLGICAPRENGVERAFDASVALVQGVVADHGRVELRVWVGAQVAELVVDRN